jgi:hypothetical protein
MYAEVDIEQALAEPVVAGVLERWWDVRQYFPEGGAPYSGGVLDAWPGVDVDGFALCYGEERAIDEYLRWKEGPRDG